MSISTEDGERIIGWWAPPRNRGGVVLYLHGTPSTLKGYGLAAAGTQEQRTRSNGDRNTAGTVTPLAVRVNSGSGPILALRLTTSAQPPLRRKLPYLAKASAPGLQSPSLVSGPWPVSC